MKSSTREAGELLSFRMAFVREDGWLVTWLAYDCFEAAFTSLIASLTVSICFRLLIDGSMESWLIYCMGPRPSSSSKCFWLTLGDGSRARCGEFEVRKARLPPLYPLVEASLSNRGCCRPIASSALSSPGRSNTSIVSLSLPKPTVNLAAWLIGILIAADVLEPPFLTALKNFPGPRERDDSINSIPISPDAFGEMPLEIPVSLIVYELYF